LKIAAILSADFSHSQSRHMPNLREQIKQQAYQIGFDEVGISTALTSEHGHALDQWLAEGKHGDMEWMARDPNRRKNIHEIFPDAKSVIVVAFNYHVETSIVENQGIVAHYARGRDYHKIMTSLLKQFSQKIEELGGTETRTKVAVDTSAILEREFAQRAGISWVGKSSMAISKSLGTWFLLGEIITNLDLEEDLVGTNHCGKCTRCIDECPTGAITEPYHLDARKCIAYLTIECKGDIPEKYRAAVGNRIFGCDDCLTVCPWNRFAKEAHEFKKSYRADLVHLDPRDILKMSTSEFELKFNGTPMRRLGLERLQRNASVVLGNIGNRNDQELLKDTSEKNPSELVRRHAEWASRRICESA
jgi:epoxyqueuosine reductase